jgi:hypothetical protein
MKELLIIDCLQNTPEWYKARSGHFTGSDVHKLIWTPEIYKTGDKKGTEKPVLKGLLDLVEEKLCEDEYGITQYEVDVRVGRTIYANYEPNIGINGKYGHSTEADALEHYAKKYDEEIYLAGFINWREQPLHVGCSPDALHLRKQSGVETKCPVTLVVHRRNSKLQKASDLKELNENYYWQVLHNMLVCEADSWDYVSYFPFIEAEKVMSCLYISKEEVQEDLAELKRCLEYAITLKGKL